MSTMYCPRCSLTLRPQAGRGALEHCPRCLGRFGLVERMLTLELQAEAADDSGLEVLCWCGGSLLRVGLHGRLDRHSRQKLERELHSAEQLDVSCVLFDLRGLSYMDDSGVAALLTARQRALAAGREFVMRAGTQVARHAFERFGVAELLSASEMPWGTGEPLVGDARGPLVA